MFKLMIIFKQPAGQIRDFEIRYNELLGLVERMPGIKRRAVTNVLGSPAGSSPYYRILEAYFDDQSQLETAMLSPIGQEAGGHMSNFPPGSFELVLADVYEESGGQTPEQDSTQGDE